MQFSVYDLIHKINLMQDIMDDIEAGRSIEGYTEDITDIFQEYSDILKNVTVKI